MLQRVSLAKAWENIDGRESVIEPQVRARIEQLTTRKAPVPEMQPALV